MNNLDEKTQEKLNQEERGLRIKSIRENELKMTKTELGKKIGVSGQFLGQVEKGKSNLSYKSIKKLVDLSKHSSDYILYGLDDTIIEETKSLLDKYSDYQIIQTLNMTQNIISLIKSN